jgi:hypothetical protein
MQVENYINHVNKSIDNTIQNISNITQDILNIHGMSGVGTRHFYNNIVSMPDARYLEIGVWKGSSVCAAMCNNKATVVCIDNWSEFDGPKDAFIENFNKFKGDNDATFIETDSFKFDINNFKQKFNIYMYDGRMEPPVSVPVAAGVRRAATAAALPPEDPPGMRLTSHGLVTAWGLAEGTAMFSLAEPMANSSQLSLPSVTMPASRSLRTTVASKGER